MKMETESENNTPIQYVNTQNRSVRNRKLSCKWKSEEIKELINNMECREFLWNPFSPLYKNRNLRELNWAEVSTATTHSVDDCKMMWNTLKTRFNFETRKTRAIANVKNGKKYTSTWEYYSALWYLLPTRPISPVSSTAKKWAPPRRKSRKITKEDNSICKEDNTICKEDNTICKEDNAIKTTVEKPQIENQGDDMLSKGWACQLQEMELKQRQFARKLISDILFNGCMGQLNLSNTRKVSDLLK